MSHSQSSQPSLAAPSTRAEESRSFIVLAAVMAPVLSVVFVAGYGFTVWIYQLFAGPPGS
ncbi:nitrate reductase NapE [Roseateles sp. YR242]|uniref:periplasmic nitrate reductase, NapE protein n=1 Tax=Roseateles sp. YR242 TaxID=1855305 RepID=UPI0008B87E85|nr:periplasmic nitrate reductase, NapE protein [Roseateles sp. YR242]SEK97970.1 nitrate reductase NapE [Roseateles sp. YR242]